MMGRSFSAGVTAIEIGRHGIWEVFCNRCLSSIGEMTGPMIQRAVMSTLGRGGVLCSDCRAFTCDICGLATERPEEVKNNIRGGMSMLCPGCYTQLYELGMITKDRGKVACLVVQNSTKTTTHRGTKQANRPTPKNRIVKYYGGKK